MKTINLNQLQQKLNEGKATFKLINALDCTKFNLMHIPGSLSINDIEETKATLNKEDDIVVYGTEYSGHESTGLYYKLKSLGYTNVTRFGGGLMEWFGKGLPVEGWSLVNGLAA